MKIIGWTILLDTYEDNFVCKGFFTTKEQAEKHVSDYSGYFDEYEILPIQVD